MKGNTGDICPLCHGKKTPGTTTFVVDLGFGVFVVRDVPALVNPTSAGRVPVAQRREYRRSAPLYGVDQAA